MQAKKILIIDDSQVDRELEAMMLEKNGFIVSALSSGRKCLDIIDLDKPDLILLDIVLPDEDGNEILKKIRLKFSPIELPVIMVTGNTDAQDVVQSLNLGANDYISKPVEYDVAIKRIQTHLKISELSEQMGKLKELEAIKAMIATYSHEINNPLTVALGKLDFIKANKNIEENIGEVEKSLWRIVEIIRKTKKLLNAKEIELEPYDDHSSMVKISK